MYVILAADIGATNCRFALFRAAPGERDVPLLTLEREQWLAGADYPEFRHALALLRPSNNQPHGYSALLAADRTVSIAVFAPAGPVEGDSCRISNLPWLIRCQDITEVLGIGKVHLINDFAAQAYACLAPEQLDLALVLPGEPVPNAPVAVVGAGTGFGQALILNAPRYDGALPPLTVNAKRARLRIMRQAVVLSSEGGHCDFPFSGREEQDFADFVRQHLGIERIIGDTIVSGSGLAHIIAYLTGKRLAPREASAHIADCPKALEWFARFYGRACRNYVLATLARGGLYITGGMAQRVPVLTHPAFAEEFYNSVSQQSLLRNVPVWQIRKPQAGLWGAALYGMLCKEAANEA